MAATAAANPFPYWQPDAVTGIDFTKQFPNIAYKYQPTGGLIAPPAPVGTYDTGSALPSSADTAKYYKEVLKELYPLQLQQTLDAAKIQQQMNEQGFASAYPWISQAANQSRAADLKAREVYRSFVESQPSSVQNIMASKQAQMATAAGAEADRARAMAAQQDAATRFARGYSV